MKKSLLLLAFLIWTLHIFSQADISGGIVGHQRLAGRYCGWSPAAPGSVAGSFELRNDFAGQPITFFTGGAGPGFQRMIINGSTGPTAGFVGIGTNFLNPVSLLNLNGFGNNTGQLFRSDGSQNVSNMWRIFTGLTANTTNEKARVFVDNFSNTQGVNNWFSGQTNTRFNHFSLLSAQGDMIFFAKGADRNVAPTLPGTVAERLRISAGNYDDMSFNSAFFQDFARVSISASSSNIITDPLAMLHIGDPTFYGAGGHRPWMNYGIFINKHDDNIFLGEKQDEFNLSSIGNVPDYNDNQHAVLVWADNSTNSGTATSDVFRIMFSGVFQNGSPSGTANHMNALEAMRLAPVAIAGNPTNSGGVNVGVGDFSRNNALFQFGNPARRLEVLTDKTTANANGNPQVRITNFQQDPANMGTTGKYTELHVTQTGNMGILAFDNTISGTNTVNQTFSQRFIGINTINPGNTFEVNSQYAAFNTPNGQPQATGFGAPTGWGGLRFTDLNSASVVQANPGVGVLSVNANGDFILVPDQMGTGVGGGLDDARNGTSKVSSGGFDYVELGLNPLIHATTIPCASHAFEINSPSSNVSIGSNPNIYPTPAPGVAANIAIGQFNTFNNQHSYVFGRNNTLGYNDYALGTNNQLANANASFAFGTNVKHDNVGGGALSTGLAFGEDLHNYNAHSTLIGRELVLPPNGPSMVSIGTHFNSAAVSNMEAYIAANPGASYTQIDADAQASNGGLQPSFIPGINVWNNNMVGIGKLNPSSGTKLDVAGSITCIGFTNNSDTTLKTNIQPINSNFATQKVKGFRAISYEWINKLDTAMYNIQFGFGAQQIETILSDLVHTGRDGKKSISYNGIIALTTKALQEEINRNDGQDSVIQALSSYITSCCSSNSKTQQTNAASQTTIEVKLSLPTEIYISEARPNPNNGKAEINYYVPTNIASAKVIFTDMLGRTINEVDLSNGYGTMAIDTKDLPNGLYSYTLQADGKIIDTKKMLKQQ